MAKGLFQRVADEARPPAVLGRYGLYEDFDNTDNWKDPITAIDQANVRKFAAMDPVVDLESLRGMKVKLVYNDEL